MAAEITIAAPPNTSDIAAQVMAWMGAQSGVITDYNKGSQIRTLGESLGSVNEIQGVVSQALAYQAAIYAAFFAYGITPLVATSSVGTLTLQTAASGTLPLANQSVYIPAGTMAQTTGGVQFQTTESVTLLAGTSSISATISAVIPGAAGNVAANTITQLVSSVSYPLYVNNAAATTQGIDAETPDQTLSRFTAAVASVGLGTPISIANAVVGVTASGSTERVMLSTCYEPWVLGLSGAGYQVYIDNGSGAASTNLITQVTNWLNGLTAPNQVGYRPAGVPYSVQAVVTSGATVSVSGTLIYPQFATQVTTAAATAEQNYFNSLQFGATAESSQLTAAVGNAVAGYVNSLTVALNLGGNPVSSIAVAPYGRVILNSSTNLFT